MALGPIVVVDTENADARDPVTLNRLESLRVRLGAASPERGFAGDESHPAGERVLANAARLMTEEPTAS